MISYTKDEFEFCQSGCRKVSYLGLQQGSPFFLLSSLAVLIPNSCCLLSTLLSDLLQPSEPKTLLYLHPHCSLFPRAVVVQPPNIATTLLPVVVASSNVRSSSSSNTDRGSCSIPSATTAESSTPSLRWPPASSGTDAV